MTSFICNSSIPVSLTLRHKHDKKQKDNYRSTHIPRPYRKPEKVVTIGGGASKKDGWQKV